MQRAYLSKLLELAEQDPNVLHLVADSGTGFDEMFQRYFPKQMINFGIAEEHMTAAAAGMATVGKIPFVYTAGAFLAYRSLEFIRDDICFQNLNVKIVGMGSGLAWSSLGPTHHTTEDIAVLRALPNITIFSPATPYQVSVCVEEAYRTLGPVYIRIGMNNEKEFFGSDYSFPVSGQDLLCRGGNIVIFTTGSILEEVMGVAELLNVSGIELTVIHVTRIKPFDDGFLLGYAPNATMFVTVEEHNIYGGLGSVLAECMAEHGINKRLIRIGLRDCFALGYGKTQQEVRKQNGLDAQSITDRLKKELSYE